MYHFTERSSSSVTGAGSLVQSSERELFRARLVSRSKEQEKGFLYLKHRDEDDKTVDTPTLDNVFDYVEGIFDV